MTKDQKGEAKATVTMLRKIALREGIGDVLAQGMLHAIEAFSPEVTATMVAKRSTGCPWRILW